jgi:hypothetical protein
LIDSIAVPFTASYHGSVLTTVVEMRGVLRSEADALAVEFRTTKVDYNNPLKPVEGEIQTARIPWPDIQSLTFRPRWFRGGRVIVRTRGLQSLAALPNANGNEVVLNVRRADRAQARELTSLAELARVEEQLRGLESTSDPRLPPGSLDAM